ncbi:Putative borealin [Septoria linicola]|uniref:Borealin n=1 Tax=Septoria linicola TaxID=215465 RepID=A0A9Q9ADF8_9PEZI|nr:putative borealin [Septoria linicola]USW47509.1 Putative borealin [Septoria linicola]
MATHTPQRSPTRASATITQVQKQALIDNLQLEITDRARKLRAQYALQSQGLRARLELRVNRIPQALRKRNIQELIDEHHAKSRPAPPPPVLVASKLQVVQTAPPQPARTTKRKSDEISVGDDKENIPSQAAQEIPNPKKRTKTNVAANSKAMRARNAGPAGVLSPKSHNSRTLPHSPIKPLEKSAPPRPMSSAQSTIAKPTRAPSRQAKRPGTASDTEGRASEASNTSAGTTIITKTGGRKPATTAKKPATVKGPSATRKPAVAKAEPAAATRTLRKRN